MAIRKPRIRDLADHHLNVRPTPLALALTTALLLGGCALPRRLAPTTVSVERVSAMVQIADDEWRRWGSLEVRLTADGDTCALLGGGACQPVDDGCGRESAAALCPVVNDYWRALPPGAVPPDPQDCSRTNVCEAVWPAGEEEPVHSPPWSAAFISAVLRRAGFTPPEFAFAAAHAQYIAAARDLKASAFEAVATPTAVDVGDLICLTRLGGVTGDRPLRLDEIRDRPGVAVTPMHCDIVVAVDRAAHTVAAIGGNVQQSVARRTIGLDADNRLAWSPWPALAWTVVMKPRRDYTPPPF